MVVLPFGEDSRGEDGSDSEPRVERGASEGAGRGAHAAHPDPPSVMTADNTGTPTLVLSTGQDTAHSVLHPHSNPRRQMLSFLHR